MWTRNSDAPPDRRDGPLTKTTGEDATSSSETTSSGCPVMRQQGQDVGSDEEASTSSSWWPFASFSSRSTGPNAGNSTAAFGMAAAKRPNVEKSDMSLSSLSSTSAVSPDRNRVASIEEEARYAQTPHANQQIPLATHRQVSSIPRQSQEEQLQSTDSTSATVSSSLPQHQHGTEATSNHWMYPSEQQFYNALQKKGWTHVSEHSIPTVVQIHNTVNEQTWQQIRRYYGSSYRSGANASNDQTDNDELVLVRFQGRPRDWTPKAWFQHYIMFQPAPFDRHDWYVGSRQNGSVGEDAATQRFVIDYYMTDDPRTSRTANASSSPLPQQRVLIDARPALDGPFGMWLRARRAAQSALPGIASYLNKRQLQRQRQTQEQREQQQSAQD